MSVSRIMVTGAGGFLGETIGRHLARAGHEVMGVGKNVSDRAPFATEYMELPCPAFERALERFRPEALAHTAGSSSVMRSMETAYDDFSASVNLYAYLLNAVRRIVPQCRVVFLSSAAVYGNPSVLPIRETDLKSPISVYGCHKLLAEKLAGAYQRLYRIKTVNLRIFSAYGEGLSRQVVYDMFTKFSQGRDVELFGTGGESRDFVHADDVARCVEIVTERDDFSNGVYNVASGVETKISYLADMMRRAVNPPAKVTFNGKVRTGDPLRWHANIDKVKGIGFAPTVSLGEGVARVVKYWRENAL